MVKKRKSLAFKRKPNESPQQFKRRIIESIENRFKSLVREWAKFDPGPRKKHSSKQSLLREISALRKLIGFFPTRIKIESNPRKKEELTKTLNDLKKVLNEKISELKEIEK
jgi:site-specific recombinase XerD